MIQIARKPHIKGPDRLGGEGGGVANPPKPNLRASDRCEAMKHLLELHDCTLAAGPPEAEFPGERTRYCHNKMFGRFINAVERVYANERNKVTCQGLYP